MMTIDTRRVLKEKKIEVGLRLCCDPAFVRLSVARQSSIETAERIKLIFGTQATHWISFTVCLLSTPVSPAKKGGGQSFGMQTRVGSTALVYHG